MFLYCKFIHNLMFGNLFGEVVRIIKKWQPKEQYKREEHYRDELIDVLDRELNAKPAPPFALTPKKRISIRPERGRSMADIAIGRRIGIELKRNLSRKKDVNRCVGQIVDYKSEYADIIVVLVGETKKTKLVELKDAIRNLKGPTIYYGLNREPRIRVIDKGSVSRERKPQGNRRERGLFDLDIDLGF